VNGPSTNTEVKRERKEKIEEKKQIEEGRPSNDFWSQGWLALKVAL
jgi:hypothetical protein